MVRLRNRVQGSNGQRWELHVPRALQSGVNTKIHTRIRGAAVRTTLMSGTDTTVAAHVFDPLSAGLLLVGPGPVPPGQVWGRRVFALVLVLPLLWCGLAFLPRRLPR